MPSHGWQSRKSSSQGAFSSWHATLLATSGFGNDSEMPQLIEEMVRPEKFELPAFWFVAVAAREFNDLHGLSGGSLEWHQQGSYKGFRCNRACQSNSIRVGPGHKIRHSCGGEK
jgi:hypothetical protein